MARNERTTMYWKGRKYIKCAQSMRKIVFRCTKYRSGCKATLIFSADSEGYIESAKAHICVQPTVATTVQDVSAEMKDLTDELAITNPAMPTRIIWNNYVIKFMA